MPKPNLLRMAAPLRNRGVNAAAPRAIITEPPGIEKGNVRAGPPFATARAFPAGILPLTYAAASF
jgi:hypothetical protein